MSGSDFNAEMDCVSDEKDGEEITCDYADANFGSNHALVEAVDVVINSESENYENVLTPYEVVAMLLEENYIFVDGQLSI